MRCVVEHRVDCTYMYLFWNDESLSVQARLRVVSPAFLLEIAVMHVTGYLIGITGCDRCERRDYYCIVVGVLLAVTYPSCEPVGTRRRCATKSDTKPVFQLVHRAEHIYITHASSTHTKICQTNTHFH